MTKTVKIEGMMCQHCAAHVKDALQAFSGVNAEVDLEHGTATLQGNEIPSEQVLSEAIEKAGYKAVGFE